MGQEVPPMTTATRVDPTNGTTDEVAYFGAAPRMYGVLHRPAGEPRAGLVVCPSVYGELVNIYRMEVIQSRHLAARGIAVQRFHYRGDGNSEGGIELLSLDLLVNDAGDAHLALVDRTGVGSVGFLGAGMGALVAATAAEHNPGAPLVLWHPQLNGSDFFRAEQMVDKTDADGYLRLLGFTLHRNLLQSLIGRNLIDALQTPRPVLIVQMAGGEEPSEGITAIADVWRGRGADVTVAAVGGNSKWWDSNENWQSHETRGRTQRTLEVATDWIVEHL
ncbi:hypothetical protein BH24ACT7_BH24ACT7_03980 [soil metagenome]